MPLEVKSSATRHSNSGEDILAGESRVFAEQSALGEERFTMAEIGKQKSVNCKTTTRASHRSTFFASEFTKEPTVGSLDDIGTGRS
jgi:hypothetical protein